jgi:hypothetical protein
MHAYIKDTAVHASCSPEVQQRRVVQRRKAYFADVGRSIGLIAPVPGVPDMTIFVTVRALEANSSIGRG